MTLLQELHVTIRKMQNKLYGAEIVVDEEKWEVAKLCTQLDKIKQVKASMYDTCSRYVIACTIQPRQRTYRCS